MRHLSVIAVCLLAACEGPVSPPPSTPLLNGAPPEHAVAQSVKGGAHRWSGGAPFILSVQANKRTDGSVSGSYHVDVKALNASFDVTVTCLSVVGNHAWIGGIVRDSNTPLVAAGTSSYFYVIDTGEGSIGAIQLDIISGLRLNDTPGNELTFCADQSLTLPSRRIDDGNVQVRG
ncbi:MAG TPA: hypothetical protein VFZ73_10635 [Gemmatimonadaceae bacterium]